MRLAGARAASVALACALALGACSAGDGDGNGEDGGSEPTRDETSASVSDQPSQSPTDDETEELTEPGAALGLGDTATVEWMPNQGTTSTIAVTVERIDRGPARDLRAIKVDPPLKDPRLYYVRFTLENKGESDLGGLSPLVLPLYLDDGSDVLKPAADIRVRFESCPLRKLPTRFGQGHSVDLCLVYAVEADLVNISLRPDDTSALITWTGQITKPERPGRTGPANRR